MRYLKDLQAVVKRLQIHNTEGRYSGQILRKKGSMIKRVGKLPLSNFG